MDTIERLNKVTDPDMQTLLLHATRFALQHTAISTGARTQKTEDKEQEQRNAQAAVIHDDTATLLNAMVSRLLDVYVPAEAEAPAPTPPPNVKSRKKN